jgi:hypothetical protein
MIIGSINNETIKIINHNNPTTIVFASHFNEYLEEDFFPDSVEKIIFGYKSNIINFDYQLIQMICEEDLFTDDNSFSKFNSKSINNFEFKTNIKWIIFPQDSTFNQNLTTLPKNLEFLSLGYNYTKSLKTLPIGLKYFILSTNIYQSDLCKIPEGIEYFGLKTSNDNILSIVPKMTKYLELDTYRNSNVVISNNQVLENLPDGIEVLKLKCSYNSELKNLPKFLKKLHISKLYSLDTLLNLPPLLESLDITFSSKIHNNSNNDIYFSNLPNCLKDLSIDVNFSYGSIIKPKLNLNNLPESLFKLSIKTYLFDGIFDNLPNCLEEFETEIYETDEIDYNNIFNNLPRNLKKFKIEKPKKYDKNILINLSIKNAPDLLEKIIVPENIYVDLDKKIEANKYDNKFKILDYADLYRELN